MNDLPTAEGIVKEALPGLQFRVSVEGFPNDVLAYIKGKMKIHRIKVLAGDRVVLELAPDRRRGRIVRRL